MKRIGCLLWHKFHIDSIRRDSTSNALHVYFEVPFILESSASGRETIERLNKAISNRLEMEKLPVGQLYIILESVHLSDIQMAKVSMVVTFEKHCRRWEFEYKTQEAFNA